MMNSTTSWEGELYPILEETKNSVQKRKLSPLPQGSKRENMIHFKAWICPCIYTYTFAQIVQLHLTVFYSSEKRIVIITPLDKNSVLLRTTH